MSPPVRLLSVATAVPPYRLDQEDVRKRARTLFERRGYNIDRLLPAYANAGIDTRYSCVPIEWYEKDHDWPERNRLYLDNAVALLAETTERIVAKAGISIGDIDQVVVVSSTGIATPSLDALLGERLPLRADCRRLPVFGLGCAGGVVGLARAAQLARGDPGANVLLLVVELCALTFRKEDLRKSNVIATALFGDGAAGALVRADAHAQAPIIGEYGEHRWPGSLDVMGWDVANTGLSVIFSRDIPTIVRRDFGDAYRAFLASARLTETSIDRFVCHPGGAKVIEALEEVFRLQAGTLRDAREILRDFGNMSAATVLFVLEKALRGGMTGRTLLSALGPGFTAAFAVLEAA